MSKNISTNDGFEEVTINNDPNRVIRINPTDFGFVERYKIATKRIDELSQKYKSITVDESKTIEEQIDEQTKIMSSLDRDARDILNFIANSNIADTVFGTVNCLSLSGGQSIFENFLESYVDYMAPIIKSEYKKSRQRVSKYTTQARKIKR